MHQSPSWSFLIDENLPESLTQALLADGYVAEHCYDVGLQGKQDQDVYAYAQAHLQTIITGDLDFSNIQQYPPPQRASSLFACQTRYRHKRATSAS